MWSISWDSSSRRDSDGHLQSSRDPRPICLYTFTKWPTYLDDMRSRGWWRWVDNDGLVNKYREATRHDDVIKWEQFPRYWDFVGGIHRSPVNSTHKGQCRGALIFSLICTLNNRLSKQSRCWWFEKPTRSLWRHCNGYLSHNNNQEKYRFLILHLASTFWIREHQRYMEMQVEITSKWNDA